MNYSESNFIAAIKQAYLKYVEFGLQSPQKMKPIHAFWADTLLEHFGEGYKIHYSRTGDKANLNQTYRLGFKKEQIKGIGFKKRKIKGRFYDRYADIVITNSLDQVILCLNIKFISANHIKNDKKTFSSILGKILNFQDIGFPYINIVIFRKDSPCYGKDKQYRYMEEITYKYLEKYIKLNEDTNFPFSSLSNVYFFCVNIYDENINIIQNDFNGKCKNPHLIKVDFKEINSKLDAFSIDKLILSIKS